MIQKKVALPIEVKDGDLLSVERMIDDGDYGPAIKVLMDWLVNHHGDLQAWYLFARLMLLTDQYPVAWLTLSYVISAGGGHQWQTWGHLGTALEHMHRYDEAIRCYQHILDIDPSNVKALVALGTDYVQQYRSDEAIAALERALDIDPTIERAKSTMGYAYLQKRDWARGWTYYEHGYGKQASRTERAYVGEPRWTGEKASLIVHGEQGIGDQIAGLEPLSRALDDNQVLAIEVSPKIASLVQRSFPHIQVHGTLHETGLEWPNQFKGICTAHASVFQLHRHYRKRECDYTGAPYLIADPARRIQWRALLDSLGDRPKIGIAWSGGSTMTLQSHRRVDLEALTPILRQPCDFISLEYRDRSDEIAQYKENRGIQVHQWLWGSASDDYDDQAALVAELNLVISVCTSVVHLAGAIGTPVWCMVHETPNIHYTAVGDTLAYYGKRVHLFRRQEGKWDGVIQRIAAELGKWIELARAA